MSPKGIRYSFKASPWQHTGPGGWHFVSLPAALSKRIRKNLQQEEEGWGRLRTTVKIGQTEWRTAIWFDTKRETYLLPLKVEIRKKEMIAPQQEVTVILWL